MWNYYDTMFLKEMEKGSKGNSKEDNVGDETWGNYRKSGHHGISNTTPLISY